MTERHSRTSSSTSCRSAVDFILEGLYAQKRISRSDDWKYQATDTRRAARADATVDTDAPASGRKKYYN